MSEEQKIDKPKLPRKTKIAVVLTIILGIFGVVVLIGGLLLESIISGGQDPMILFLGLCFLYILSAILICIKNRIAWIFAVVILSGVIAFFLINRLIHIISASDYSITVTVVIAFLVILIPLILIILDRKNYSEMLRQRELEKNTRK